MANAYLGTSGFAAEVLRILAGSEHRPALVVTPPDRPRGRGRKLAAPPAAEAALELGIPLHQTSSVNQPDSLAALADAGVEVGCVCAFGQLIKEPLLTDLPMLNIHPSLLPRWRGAAPIERALMAGDERTGVCVMRLTEGLDSGPVALTAELAIEPTETFGELAPRLSTLGGRMLVEALSAHAAGTLGFEEQPEEGVTYAEKIEPADRRLDPACGARELAWTVRALTPHIGAHLELAGGERLGVREARAQDGPALEPGVAEAGPEGELLIGCGEGTLAITRLQPPGRREMAAADYLRGKGPPADVAVDPAVERP